MVFTGSCLCGEIQYRGESTQSKYYLCHCDVCQKSSANLFASYFQVNDHQVKFSGQLNVYKSSDGVERSFCATCGTHVYYKNVNKNKVDILIGTLNNWSALDAVAHINCVDSSSKLIQRLADLPRYTD